VSESDLPLEVRRFLKEQIRSIEQLEILLLLRDGADRRWNPAEVYQHVRSSESSVAWTLENLTRHGLLAKSDGAELLYQFSPKNEQLRRTTETLAHLYAEKRVRIVEAIYSEYSEVDEFAKAFRLRKDSNG
jgi:hypothetical protein